jgi:hypothetical protein
MWSVAVVVSYMCGNPFCEVSQGEDKRLIHQWNNQLGAPRADKFTGYPAWEHDSQLFRSFPKEASAWPPGVAIALGKSGQQLVSSLFSYTPHDRPSSSEVLEHPFMAVCSFPLMGVSLEDGDDFEGSRPSVIFDNIEGLGRQLPQDGICCKSFYPLIRGVAGQSLHAGERHQWGLRCSEVAREIVLYMLADDAFMEGTDANRVLVDLALGREVITGDRHVPRCVIKGPKTRIGGHMGTVTGVSMIGICIKHPCIIARVIDFMKAFLKVNESWLLALEAACKRSVQRLGPRRRGKNGKHFLKAMLKEWFLGPSELTLIEATDGLEEEEHKDGPMSLFHGGLTLGGARDLFCNVEGFGRVRVPNSTGTFYLGNLTGPRHQVIHRGCEDHDLPLIPGLGRRSVTIMIRTALFPHLQSRYKNALPKPRALWACLKNHMVEALQKPGLVLPTLEEVKAQTQLRQQALGERPAPCPKRRRIRGKTSVVFVD